MKRWLLLILSLALMGAFARGIGRPEIVTCDVEIAACAPCNNVLDWYWRTDSDPDEFWFCTATGDPGTKLQIPTSIIAGSGNATTAVTTDEAAISGHVPVYGTDGDGDVDTYAVKKRYDFFATNLTATGCMGAGRSNANHNTCWNNDTTVIESSYAYFHASENSYVEYFCCFMQDPITAGGKTLEVVHADSAGGSASNPFNGAARQLEFTSAAGDGGTAGDDECADIDTSTGTSQGRLAVQIVTDTATGGDALTCFVDALHP